MESLLLLPVMNHEDAMRSAQCAAPVRSLRTARRATPAARFVFVTYAVEIEGDAPLYFCAEGTDD